MPSLSIVHCETGKYWIPVWSQLITSETEISIMSMRTLASSMNCSSSEANFDVEAYTVVLRIDCLLTIPKHCSKYFAQDLLEYVCVPLFSDSKIWHEQVL